MQRFAQPIDADSAQWNPKMSLLLTTSSSGKVASLYRPREAYAVWSIDLPSPTLGAVWSQDGKRVGFMTRMSQCLVYDVNSGRLLVTVAVKGSAVELGTWLDVIYHDSDRKFQGISGNNLLKSMPKLLPLPTSFNGDLKYATRQNIDTLIQQASDELDLLLLFGDSTVSITMNSLLSTGPVTICHEDEQIVRHLVLNERNYVLTSSLMTMKHWIRCFDIKFDIPYLKNITGSVSKIMALLGYIDETLSFLSQESKNYLDFNNKFLGILKDEVHKRNETISDELYNLLLTGMMNDDVKDWLENTIADRGVKKWEKLGEVTFDNVRKTIIYHLIPACERLIVLLSDIHSFHSIILFHSNSNDILILVEATQKSVKAYLASIYAYIIKVNREQELFNAFIAWVNATLVELQDEDPSKYPYKTSEVSQFIINNHLERSVLFMLIPNFKRGFNQVKINSADLFDRIKAQIKEGITAVPGDIELGIISDSNALVGDDQLFAITQHKTHLEIFRVDPVSLKRELLEVKFANGIKDFKVNNCRIIVLVDNELRSIDLKGLPFENSSLDGCIISTHIITATVVDPTRISVNFIQETACIISSDLQKYEIVELAAHTTQ